MKSAQMLGLLFASFAVGYFIGSPALLAYADISIGPGIDSDSDGLSDSFETRLGSDPAVSDTDKDGLADGLEYTGGSSGIQTDPTKSDTDADGLLDGLEIITGTDPTDVDSDNDGLTDSYEMTAGTNPSQRDTDGDGLSDSLELLTHNTDPHQSDTDVDGVPDNIEVWHGSDPTDDQSFFVLPESPIGAVAMIAASMVLLGGFMAMNKSKEH